MRTGTAMVMILLLHGAVAAFAYDHAGITYRDLAEYYAGKGNEPAALENYSKALAVAPNDVQVYQSRGFYYLTRQKPDLALQDFTKQIGISPDDPAGYLNRGMLLGALGRGREADADFARACALGSHDGCIMGKTSGGAAAPAGGR